MFEINPLFKTDSYKISHPRMYPEGTTKLKTYIESRGTDIRANVVDVPITWVGFQMWVKELASTVVTHKDNEQARDFYKAHFMGADIYPYDDIKCMIDKYYGHFPVKIMAAPEGTTFNSHNVVATIESTDERLFWMTSFLETQAIRAAWYAPSVATRDMRMATEIYKYLLLTSDNPDVTYWSRNHDFGARAATSDKSAQIAGAVHTLISGGSDTVEGIAFAQMMYDYKGMPAFSIPASEHSVTTAHGKQLEHLIVNKTLNNFPGAPVVANVVDSYDMMNFVDNIIGKQYKQDIIDSGKLYVIRPDSGDAVTNVVMILKSLANNFGFTINKKGYKVLNHVAIINGDGNTIEQIKSICDSVMNLGFSLDNIAFGTGGYLHQMVNRDTFRFALKLCFGTINGKDMAFQKDPITDVWKKSRGGDLDLVQVDGEYQTVDRMKDKKHLSALETVYLNGVTPVTYNFEEVRNKLFETIKLTANKELSLV